MVAALDARLEILRAGKNENDAVREYERGHSDLVAAPDCSPTWPPRVRAPRPPAQHPRPPGG
jgi:hypothetical protein